eukprot:CAMPEP_0197178526 /NCGR_PEP_ID=MMETSP1423-20130617/3780_1 /TAXON_ID=476441 /ORGANISM="Pseudo-nitzschia heimii, Strain UNC1101" /LENGTH=81 /DNA_ID=CAMNT_0042628291 /DNA_START=81 /DNA_END=326 /DNA_ORIENTATION=+
MDSLPPNDPNRNNGNGNGNGNNNGRRAAKEQPHDGSRSGRGGRQDDGQPMDIMGDMRESPAVVAMFLVGIASWLLRERCVC